MKTLTLFFVLTLLNACAHYTWKDATGAGRDPSNDAYQCEARHSVTYAVNRTVVTRKTHLFNDCMFQRGWVVGVER